jgi:fucose permease
VTFVYSLLMGLTDLFMNAEASVVERDLGKPVFSSFHAAVLYAIGLFGLLGSYVSVNFGAIWCLVPPLPFVALALWSVYRAIPHQPPEPEARVAKVDLPYRLLTFIGLIVGLDVVCEQSCWAWAGQLLNEKAPALAAYSGLGVAFYGMCNGTARLFGDGLRARFDDMWLVGLSFLVAAVGFAILAFGTGFAVAVGAFAIAGAGLGLIYPCLVSVAARLAPDARAAALGYQAAVSGPARLGMPAIQGFVARGYGLNAIYGLAAAASLLAIGVTAFTAKAISRRSA